MNNLFLTLISVMICLTIHEASHAFMAYLLGDETAKNQGRMTFNPISHIDLIGFLALVFAGFGWAKPVPVNYRNLKNYKRDIALISLAGPVSNFLLALVIFLIIIPISAINSVIASAFINFSVIVASISIGLGVFNLIPIPPLDGSNIIVPFLPHKTQAFLYKNGQIIQFSMIILLFIGVLDKPLIFLRSGIFDLLFNTAQKILFFM